MVDFIKRDKNDIYGKPIWGFLFKNQKFLIALKVVVLALFIYALYFGFTHTGKDNIFTTAVFWGIFWALFMVITLPTLGRVFCGICPHGFMGKYITKFGLKKTMPKWMQNRYIGLFLLVLGWWGIYYMFPGVYSTPLGTAILFTVMTLLSFVVYFLYKDMSYCKYICPIGTLTRAYGKLSFTWLGTYKSACNECRTFECAAACPYDLKPFTFDKRNSMTDCTLCMDCSDACEAVSFKVKKPSFSLFSKFRIAKAEVWAFVLILASISITMSFHHGIGRSNAAGDMIWSKTARYFQNYIDVGSVDLVGLFAFLYAILFTVLAAVIGMFIASKILQKDFSKIFYDLGYSYAPLFILGSIAHTLETFFTRGYEQIVKGFAQGFGFSTNVISLASRGDSWLSIFGLFKWVAILWALIILYKRMKLLDATKIRKIIAFPFAASLIIFFLSVNIYRGYILDTYGSTSHTHGSQHSSKKMFQSVPHTSEEVTLNRKTFNKIAAEDAIYFSETLPTIKKSKPYQRGSNYEGGWGKVPTKRVWPIFKDSSGEMNCIDKVNAEIYLLDFDLQISKLESTKNSGCKSIAFQVSGSGYYNLFYIDKTIENKTLYSKVVKFEFLRLDHSSDAVYDSEKMSPQSIKEASLDILRLRGKDETFSHRFFSGEKIRLKVLLHSKPVQGATLTLSTKTGWSKSVKTDKNGEAVFTLIKDYFPKWNKFDKRHRNDFFLTATYTQDANGRYDDKEYENIKYISTYTSVYYPEISSYTSYAYGLTAATLTAVLSGFIIYWFRRRQKPFKEIKFNEKN